MSNQSLQMLNFKQVVSNLNIIQVDNTETIFKLEEENQKINLHLVKAKRNVKVFGLGGLVVGVIGTVLLID